MNEQEYREVAARVILGQSKWHSLYETILNTVVGFFISMALYYVVIPAIMGVSISHSQNLAMTAIFTVASLVRGYYLRRLFNWLRHRAG